MSNERFKRVLLLYAVILVLTTFLIWRDITKGHTFDLCGRIVSVVLVLMVLWSTRKGRKNPN